MTKQKDTIHTLSDVPTACPSIFFIIIHLQQQHKNNFRKKQALSISSTSSVYRSVEDNKAKIKSEIST